MKEFIRSQLLNYGIWISKSVKEQQVLGLISELRPMYTPCPMKRYGPPADGGYLMPDDLEGVGGCVSPGVSNNCGFDTHIAELGIDVHLADASVSRPPVPHNRFTFSKLHFDTFNSSTTVTIDEFCKRLPQDNDLILQMDIEGAEYRVLNSASEQLLSRFRVMVIEFHDLTQMFTHFGFREISSVFRKLLRTHNVVHIHPNNVADPVSRGSIVIPPLMEFTFYRKDRGIFQYRCLAYPHPLDAPNVADRPNLTLPKCWY
jgi:Methyltransferase FkbM domain